MNLFEDILADVGFADVLIAYESEREGGRLVLIDGHMRAGLLRKEELPCVILDVNDEEADKLLLTLDPIGSMAEAAKDRAHALVSQVSSDLQERLAQVPSLESVLSQKPTNPMSDQLNKIREITCPHCGETFER